MNRLTFAVLFAFGVLATEVALRWRVSSIITWLKSWGRKSSEAIEWEKMDFRVTKFEKQTIDPKMEERKPHMIWNTAIFFPIDPMYQASTKYQLLYYFENVKVILRICMHLASLYEIRDIVLRKKREGLLIQVITDYDTLSSHNNWNCKAYIRAGITVRARNSGSLMHNKFVIFDDEAVMTGSLNQTNTAVEQNSENVVITTNPKVVSLYNKEFANIWKNTDDITLSMLRKFPSEQSMTGTPKKLDRRKN